MAKRPKPKGRARTTRAEMARRMLDAEELMLRGVGRHAILETLCRRYSIGNTAARGVVQRVIEAWKDEGRRLSTPEAREERRHVLRKRLEAVYESAMTRRRAGKGGKLELDPDHQSALNACAQLRALEGLDVPSSRDELPAGGGNTVLGILAVLKANGVEPMGPPPELAPREPEALLPESADPRRLAVLEGGLA
jgi:hypothetical protein